MATRKKDTWLQSAFFRVLLFFNTYGRNIRMLNETIDWLSENMENVLQRFDTETGKFMQEKGWGIVNQDTMLLLAHLYLTDHPRNPYYRKKRILELIEKAGDALITLQYPDGKVEFVKEDGSQWGPIYMPWTMYHWLETYNRLKNQLSPERAARWVEGLKLAYSGINLEMRESFDRYDQEAGSQTPESIVHNIPVWNAMGLHRAWQVFGQSEWKETGERMISLAVDSQHPDGYWSEHHGPTTLYNLVYMQALGLYYYHGGSIDVKHALEKAVRFHDIFTYPDGALVETIDGRTKFHPHPIPLGVVGFTMIPAGRTIAERNIKAAMEQKQKWIHAHFAETLRYWDQHAELAPEPTLLELESFRKLQAKALVVKEKGWYCCLSGFTTPMVESRWGQDRQSFVGVWNAANGLIIGGGNSKQQPEWSTFEINSRDGGHFYVPSLGEVDAENSRITLSYGNVSCRVRIVSIEKNRLILSYEADLAAGDEGKAHIPLKLKPGVKLNTSKGTVDTDGTVLSTFDFESGEQWLAQSGWRVASSGPFHLTWPSFPFNPYEKEGKADIAEATAILTITLQAGQARQIEIIV
jgi:hypothetical protein